MKMTVIDDRYNNDKRLCELEFGQHFVLMISGREHLCRRISTSLNADVFDDELLAVIEETGELIGINRDRWVEPVKAEIHIVE